MRVGCVLCPPHTVGPAYSVSTRSARVRFVLFQFECEQPLLVLHEHSVSDSHTHSQDTTITQQSQHSQNHGQNTTTIDWHYIIGTGTPGDRDRDMDTPGPPGHTGPGHVDTRCTLAHASQSRDARTGAGEPPRRARARRARSRAGPDPRTPTHTRDTTHERLGHTGEGVAWRSLGTSRGSGRMSDH